MQIFAVYIRKFEINQIKSSIFFCSIEVFIIHYSLPILSVKISPCAQWNKTGITVAGTKDQPGNSSNQLNRPRGIFIRKSANTLYVADTKNNRIQMFSLNQSSMMRGVQGLRNRN